MTLIIDNFQRIVCCLNVDVMRAWLGVDVILRKDGLFYCCEVIEEATIL